MEEEAPKTEDATAKPVKPRKEGGGGGGGHQSLRSALKGYLISYDQGKESQSVREILELFTVFADEYFPLKNQQEAEEKVKQGGFDSIEAEMAAELSSLKKHEHKRFFKVSTDTKGIYFIKVTDDQIDPAKFLSRLFKKLIKNAKTGKPSFIAKFTSRVLPIELTGQASLEEILIMAEKVLPRHFHAPNRPCKFKIDFRKRLNDKVPRDMLTSSLVKYIASGNKVDLKNADKIVIVEVLKGVACIGVYEEKDFPGGLNIRLLSSPSSSSSGRAPAAESDSDDNNEKISEKKEEGEAEGGIKRPREEDAREPREDSSPKTKKQKAESEPAKEKKAPQVIEKPVMITSKKDSNDDEGSDDGAFRLL